MGDLEGRPLVCFSRNSISGGEDIVEVIGTIRENSIHGMAKIKVQGGNVYVGRYLDGIPHGLRRLFSSEGKLLSVQYFRNGFATGMAWESLGEVRA